MTANDIWEQIKALFDELSKNGVAISETKNKDMELKAIKFISMGQRELYSMGNYYKKFSYIGKYVPNEIADNFEIQEFKGTDIETELVTAKAYHFSVDDDATVYIKDGSDNIIDTITATSTNGLTSYKGTISSLVPVKLVFSGTTYYRYSNVALWNIPFKTVPDYDAWIKVDLPSDLMSFNDIIEEHGANYVRNGSYKLEGFRDLYVSYDFDGEYRITYKPVPSEITSLDDEIEIDDIHALLLAYYAGTYIAPSEQPELTPLFNEKYERLRIQLMQPKGTFRKIKDAYGINRLGGN